jgi:hypothetical protein
LDVNETVAKSLTASGILPDRSTEGRWYADPYELGKWYIGLSTQDWVD